MEKLFTVRDENIIFYDIETTNDYDNIANNEEYNSLFVDRIVIPEIIRHIRQCDCSHVRPKETMSQHLIDQFECAVCVQSEHGKHKNISYIMIRCIKCGKTTTYTPNGLEMMARGYAEHVDKFVSGEYDGPEYDETTVSEFFGIPDVILDNIEDAEFVESEEKTEE